MEELIRQYSYICKIVAKQYSIGTVEYEDVYQEAMIGLIQAVRSFDEARGVQFETYATRCVRTSVLKYLRDKMSLIRLPRKLYEVISKIQASGFSGDEVLTQKHEISSLLDVDEALVEEAHFVVNNSLFVDIDDTNEPAHEDDGFVMVENIAFIQEVLKTLNDKEKQFIKYRYYDCLSQSQIALRLGVSQASAHRIEKRVLDTFRSFLYE